MTEVELEPNDRDDILQLLDYALKKKLEEPVDTGKRHFNIKGYWELRVPQLKRLIKGKKQFSVYRSSLGVIDDIKEGLDETDY